MNLKENVEFTPEGFDKAVASLDFLPEEVARQISAAFAVVSKMI